MPDRRDAGEAEAPGERHRRGRARRPDDDAVLGVARDLRARDIVARVNDAQA